MTTALEPTGASVRSGATTIATRLRDWSARAPDSVAMREKDRGIWVEVTFSQYWEMVLDVGHGLLALGVKPGHRVAIHCENRREWLYTDLAIVAVRAMTVGLYPTNPPAEVRHLLSDSGAKILVAEDQEQVDKALEVIDGLPALERIVYIEPRGIRRRYDHPKLLSWDDLVELGRSHRQQHPGVVEQRMSAATADDVMTLIYTSGTTGPPKGAMLSVANAELAITILAETRELMAPPAGPGDMLLSYLPLCHVAERIFTVWFNAASGCVVNFAESIETVQPNLREIQPTILFGVPRIWEKVLAGVNIRIASASPLKRANSAVWLRLADHIGATLVRTGGRWTIATRLAYAVGWVFMFRALRDRIGMRKVRHAISAAAPIAPEVLRFYMGIGVPMHELYGMTENAGIATTNRPGRVKLGTVGEPYEGVEVRVDERTGEILVRHPGVFAGYWQNEEATAAAIDADGWLHTGDVGEWVDGTHLTITDRMKDIIITSGGKNISPSEIENALKTSPFIKEAVVIGDKRRYVTALIGIELDTVGDWAQRRRIAYTTYRDLTTRDEVLTLVQGVVDDVNSRFSTVEQIKAFRLLPKELDHTDGELTATLKVKRGAITHMFTDLVDSMYRRKAAS